MNNISKEEYLRLINELLEEDVDEEENFIDPSANHWIPSESPLKDKIPIKIQSGIIDLTKIKKDKIKQYLFNSDTFTVDNYIIKIIRNLSNSKISIKIFEEKFRTPSGAPCRMTYKVNLRKDSRFTNCPWINKLDYYGHMLQNTDQDIFVEVIKWLQIAKKLSSFT
ncbi:hypothetical protein UFOVP1290_107 [uncultured Caudovirales phage]|uniref:Uncharacterized protein n=1 Tax=uncultured Caudovirales phage TaxID=2100421 RepID=A0A6J5RQN4_9CAUD|nr:hypothetical protein UFOVP1290_107 [uncultured Caudovirales phage]